MYYRRKVNAIEQEQRRIHKIKVKLSKLELHLIMREQADLIFGKEMNDLQRLITELDQTIAELPDGSLKNASIERRKELEMRKQNLVPRKTKGNTMSTERLKTVIAEEKEWLAMCETILQRMLEGEAKLRSKHGNSENNNTV